ncbi:hypothetical protein [Haladaptatus pallidirubidus]|uniref:hypothetical protein n=1 Tax=Haladaptatus pallidirubidus TaxID=1008152 RepID=UPI0031F037D7
MYRPYRNPQVTHRLSAERIRGGGTAVVNDMIGMHGEATDGDVSGVPQSASRYSYTG